jgi:hypothetical protein
MKEGPRFLPAIIIPQFATARIYSRVSMAQRPRLDETVLTAPATAAQSLNSSFLRLIFLAQRRRATAITGNGRKAKVNPTKVTPGPTAGDQVVVFGSAGLEAISPAVPVECYLVENVEKLWLCMKFQCGERHPQGRR